MSASGIDAAEPSPAFPTPPAAPSELSHLTERTESGQQPGPAALPSDVAPPKKKQKRNKPTLSCEECVERKTKCDRGRPTCLACVKRQSHCKYSDVANIIASADRCGATRTNTKSKKQQRPPYGGLGKLSVPPEIINPRLAYRSASTSSTSSSNHLLSNVPYTKHAPASVLGIGSAHPFANYWTAKGGLPEVVGVLPNKDQADYLTAAYFECVDPVYPIINRKQFYTDYEHFWALPLAEKHQADPVFLALQFVVYGMGLQFINNPSEQERAQMAEFYVSAAHQALRISTYLSRTSLRTIQAMVLLCYFLMNDNHASDAWSFGGILMRQAYAMGLNRDPEIILPRASPAEKIQRRKVWQAVLFQDTFLTVLLKLPPTATFSDVAAESLTDDLSDIPTNGTNQNGQEVVVNPMSISSIAPTPNPYPEYELADREYIRCMWHMANLVQETVCKPRSLQRPLTYSPREKSDLLAMYRNLLGSFPINLTVCDHGSVRRMAETNPRATRQNLFLRSNFWHCFMVIQADENEMAEVTCDVKGALEAARLAVEAFFQLWEFLQTDAGVWWVFQHRAFEEALVMARILAVQTEPLEPHKAGASVSSESLFVVAKIDISRVLDILEQVGNSCPEMQKTRTDVLRTAFEDIPW